MSGKRHGLSRSAIATQLDTVSKYIEECIEAAKDGDLDAVPALSYLQGVVDGLNDSI